MKAVYQTKYGKSDVLKYGEQDAPNIKPDQVLVDNHATSVNPRDRLIRSGRYQLQFLVPSLPLILGSDLAGKIVQVGAKVSRFKVLVNGASGGVGSYAVQIAKALGADVTAVCSANNADMVTQLGAGSVIDYHTQDFVTGADRFDVIFDTIGRHSFDSCAAVLNNGGSFVSTIPSPLNLKAPAITKLKSWVMPAFRNASVVMVSSKSSDLEQIENLVESGKLRPVIDSVFPLEQSSKAHDYNRSMRAKGKIILQIA
jgi:NADPH:quinone reductase-like Zn-dependent oxidoreductase